MDWVSAILLSPNPLWICPQRMEVSLWDKTVEQNRILFAFCGRQLATSSCSFASQFRRENPIYSLLPFSDSFLINFLGSLSWLFSIPYECPVLPSSGSSPSLCNSLHSCLPRGRQGLGGQWPSCIHLCFTGIWHMAVLWFGVNAWTMSLLFNLVSCLIFYNVTSNFLVEDTFLLLISCRVIWFLFILKLSFRSSRKALLVLIYCSVENGDPVTLSIMFSISQT